MMSLSAPPLLRGPLPLAMKLELMLAEALVQLLERASVRVAHLDSVVPTLLGCPSVQLTSARALLVQVQLPRQLSPLALMLALNLL